MIRVEIKGLDQFDAMSAVAFRRGADLKAGIRKEVTFFGEAVVGTSRERYLSGRPGLNVQTGRLRSSINYKVSDVSNGIKLAVGTDVPYAIYHEQPEGPGTGRIPKRAFLAPALEDETKPFLQNLDKYLSQFAERGFGQ